MRLELYLAQMYLFHEPLVGAAIAEAAGVRAREAGDEAGEAVAGVVSASSRRHYGEIGVEELGARA